MLFKKLWQHEKDLSHALSEAVLYSDVHKVQYLLEKGADPNTVMERKGYHVLLRAMIQQKENLLENKWICRLLIEYGADVNVRFSDGRNAHYVALQMKDFELADLIIRKNGGVSFPEPPRPISHSLVAKPLAKTVHER